ncbi:MAG: CHAT domain-containing protein, partial [Chloroflexia bacterium]|nr:CHAT domain-containing protein [Chloroflexia bacterium]
MKLGKKNIIIIADNALNKIPFEVLTTSIPKRFDNYRNLPYLIKQNSIYYAPSASFLADVKQRPKISKHSRVLSLAPIHDDLILTDTLSRSLLAVRSDTSILNSLPNANKEMLFAHKIAGGKVLSDRNATETNFKNMAGKYEILHLATHGIADSTNSLLSKLLFTKVENEPNDGLLHTYEIYNMKQSSQLVVLSACNTGSGTTYGGEGVISLARGFLSSGSRSVIMTLWSVNDQSS